MTEGAYTDLNSLIRLKHLGQGFSFLPRQPIHSLLAGQKASRLRGRGLNFEEIRIYLPGDDVRNIDWKVTARMRKPHTRVYTEERDRPAFLVVDQRVNMFFGSQRSMKSVTAAEAAALAAWRVVGAGDRVGAIVFNDTETQVIRPRRSNKTVMQILEAVVRQNNALSTSPDIVSRPERLNAALKQATQLAKHDTLVCVISDFDGADDDTRRLMTRLAQHNDVLACFVFDALETEIPELGPVVVGDGTMQVEVDSNDTTLRTLYADTHTDRLATARKFLLQRQIPIIPLDAGLPVADQLRKLLGSRPKVASR
ncbi:MAG: DUF58 domain-containing protein [Paracoccaceae bacterium]